MITANRMAFPLALGVAMTLGEISHIHIDDHGVIPMGTVPTAYPDGPLPLQEIIFPVDLQIMTVIVRRLFHKLYDNANCGIFVFTMWKKKNPVIK